MIGPWVSAAESKPPDGMSVLLWWPEVSNHAIIGYWSEAAKCWLVTWRGAIVGSSPTHWMHIPRGPS